MDGRYIIEDGEIKLALSEADFESVLEDVSECRDLLEPQIRIVNNTVIFRDHDIKLIEPELFFKKDVTDYKPNKILLRNWFIGVLLTVIISIIVGTEWPLTAAIVTMVGGLLVSFGFAYTHYLTLQLNHHRRHRKALYAKAKLLSFFYMNVLEEMTTGGDRLERRAYRLDKDVINLKERFRDVYSLLSPEQKTTIGGKFPDGDLIEDKPEKAIKYN